MVYGRTHTRMIPEMGGLAKVMPWLAATFYIAGLASLGLPGLSGFVAEAHVFLGGFFGNPWADGVMTKVLTIIDTSIIDYLGYSARSDAIDTSRLDGAAGRSEGYVIKLSKFKCLGFELDNFTVACHDMNTRLGVAGLLGMNFLEHFRIDMNYYTGEIHAIEKITIGDDGTR